MRLALILALFLLTLPAAAQSPDAGPFAKRTAMLLVGTGVSVGTVAATNGSVGGILLAPLVSALSVYGTGLALRGEGDFKGTLGGAALGALPGVALGLAGGATLLSDGCSDVLLCNSEGALLLVVGAVLYLIGPPIGAVIGFGSVETVQGRLDVVPGTHLGPSVPTAGLRLSF